MSLLEMFRWAHIMSGQSRLFSWVTHGLLALPLVALVAWQPWTAPGLVFFYREAEQVLHRLLNGQALDPLDHFMDVAVPAFVGWLFLH